MTSLSLHLAPNAPWPWLVLASLAFAVLALWAYSFRLPPLTPVSRRTLSALRVTALAVLVWLLAMPVLERALPSAGTRVVVLEDRSLSMDGPERAGGVSRPRRARGARVRGHAARGHDA